MTAQEFLETLEGYTPEQRKDYAINIMVSSATRRNALRDIRLNDIPDDDRPLRDEVQTAIDDESQTIAECYKALKELDAE